LPCLTFCFLMCLGILFFLFSLLSSFIFFFLSALGKSP
jgi:hypothetical protein